MLFKTGKCVLLPAPLRHKLSSDIAPESKTTVTSPQLVCPFKSQPEPTELALCAAEIKKVPCVGLVSFCFIADLGTGKLHLT